MFERFTTEARAATAAAQEQAATLGARQIEAEHLLLALASAGVAGLDHATVLDALEDEERASLAAVGVRLDDFDVPAATPALATRLRFGASARAALEGSLRVALDRGDRRITAGHLLLALLRPAHGRVPRALALAGEDLDALADRAGAATAQR